MTRKALLLSLMVLLVTAASTGHRAAARATTEDAQRYCDLLGPKTPLPYGPGTCPGVRPGAQLHTSNGSCTFNFLFKGSDGRRYIGSAGHCIVPAGGGVWKPSKGPAASDGSGREIGNVVYAIEDDFSYRDFALIAIKPGVKVDPQMCHFGGPTGVNTDITSDTTLLHHFGYGAGFALTIPARTAIATRGLQMPTHIFAEGLAVFGDSGGAVVDARGRAVGLMEGLGPADVAIESTDDVGVVRIIRIGPMIKLAEGALGIRLRLLTADLLP